MATSVVDICNRALVMLGAGRIDSLSADIEPARLCSEYYPGARDDILNSHPFNGAVKRAQLAALPDAPIYGFDRQFQLPNDCLRVWEADTDYRWVVEGDVILTDATAPLNIRYISSETDPTKYGQALVQAISTELAARMAPRLARDQQTAETIKRDAAIALRRARSLDGQEGELPRQPQGPFLDAFYHG